MVIRRKKAIWIISSIVAALWLFSIYLYQLPGAIAATEPQMQLSRIDFQEPVDSLSANRIKGIILAQPGVQQTYFNLPDHIVVFSHDPKIVSAASVLREIRERYAVRAERFLPDIETGSSSCPVTGTNSIFVRMGAYLRRTF